MKVTHTFAEGGGELKDSHIVLYDIAKFLGDGKSMCTYNYLEKTKNKVLFQFHGLRSREAAAGS
jgi:hypothetical protein